MKTEFRSGGIITLSSMNTALAAGHLLMSPEHAGIPRLPRPARVSYITRSPCPGIDWLSAPGRGVNITRQRGVCFDASTRNSSSGTSMSMSPNSKLKASPHVGRADEARRSVVLPSHPPQLLPFGQGHPQPAVTAGDGAFDLNFSGHVPYITTAVRNGFAQ